MDVIDKDAVCNHHNDAIGAGLFQVGGGNAERLCFREHVFNDDTRLSTYIANNVHLGTFLLRHLDHCARFWWRQLRTTDGANTTVPSVDSGRGSDAYRGIRIGTST